MLLASKRDQEYKVASFLTELANGGVELSPWLQAIAEEDESRVRESLQALTMTSSPVMTEPQTEPRSPEWTLNKVVLLTPPSDILRPPPEPLLMESVSECTHT